LFTYLVPCALVTASNLLLLDETGTVLEGEGEIDATAFFIHKAIHQARGCTS
jgi:ribulose-5-phosphate 4-epimerase/fuculose-1-phosphate aldolase